MMILFYVSDSKYDYRVVNFIFIDEFFISDMTIIMTKV
jgi:hypothetical protein